MRTSLLFSLFFYLVSTSVCISATHPAILTLELLLQSLSGLTSYYNSHYNDVNLDGLFGILVLRNSIRDILDSRRLPEALESQLSGQLKTINSFYGSALAAVKARDQSYYEKFGSILQLPWIPKPVIFGPAEMLHFELPPSGNVFGEDISKQCLADLLRSNKTNDRCLISPICKNALLSGLLKGYEATRVILYLSTVQQLSCAESLAIQLVEYGQSVSNVQDNFCSGIYAEFMNLLNSNSTEFYSQRDLFLEQVFVCGFQGFGRFLKATALDTIVSWQHPSGCFAGSDDEVNRKNAASHEKPFLEERLGDGCLTHLTSVATAALSVYLNYFLRPSDMNPDYADAFLRLIEAYYSGRENPYLPPLLMDNPSETAPKSKFQWKPAVELEVVSRLGLLHGFGYHPASQPKPWPLLPTDSITIAHFYVYLMFLSIFVLVLYFLMKRRTFKCS